MKRLSLIAAALLIAQAAGAGVPATLVWEGDHLHALRTRGAATVDQAAAIEQLVEKARASQRNGVYSVVDKKMTPASGDKHDYASFGRYWWPNPDTPDGLPYVRRDGVVNPGALDGGDRVRLARFCDDVEATALSAYLLHDEAAGEHAARLLRVWFLDEATRMRPRVRYGQAVPGRTDGRGAGVLDTRNFLRVLDAIALLRETGAVDDATRDGLIAWFEEYLVWLKESPIAAEERDAANNHGTWFAAQEAGVAAFVGDRAYATRVLARARDQRLDKQFAADGSQPHEAARTQSLHYHLFNVTAWFTLARVGEHLGVDLWSHESARGRSMRKGLDYALVGVADAEDWPHPTLSRFALSSGEVGVLLLAADRWKAPHYRRTLETAPRKDQGRRLAPLLFADPYGEPIAVAGVDPPTSVADAQ
ncbi:MAG: alginate lyase family protein [Planctomycetota bacterium]